MDTVKMLVCLALAFVLLTDVVISRPTGGDLTGLEAIVADIDHRLIRSEKKRSRRRRHLPVQQLALMEFCLRYRHKCRQTIQNMRNRGRNVSVVLIEK